MNYTIKRGIEDVITVRPEGKLSRKLMAEEIVEMTFTLPHFVVFQIGDSVEIFGNTYYLAAEPAVQKVSEREFVHQLQFTGIKYRLAEVQLLFLDSENELTVPEFSIMGTASTILDLIVQNANRLQSGWTKGVVEETETKQISFSGHNCLTAIAKVAEEFKLEFWIDGDKSIHFTERKEVSGYTFEYGKGKGLRGENRTPVTDSAIVTRLYATGSDKNLPKNYRNGQNRLRMDVPYLEKNTDRYGTIEHTEKFEDIYPKRIGTVTAVDAANPLIFTDSTLDFDLNEADSDGTKVLIPNVAAKVVFQTGQLAGYRLEIREKGYNTATKTFVLNKNQDEKALEVPNDLMRPAVGDTYILEDIFMPDAYVTAAEAELKAKAQEYLDANCLQRFRYAVVADSLYFRAMNVQLALGDTVNLVDDDFTVDEDIRVITLVQDLQDPYDVRFELADTATLTSITREYFEQEKNQVLVQQGIKYNAALARRSYLFAREFHDKVFDNEGYFDTGNIKPLSIETKMISLGSRMQQFSLPNVSFFVENNNTRLRNTSGKLVHLTINEDAPREWNIAANQVNGISTNFNNIYIKAQRAGNNASFVVTEQNIMVDQDPDFYHFEVGYLSSVIGGVRRIKTTYGFAQLNPSELSIGKISDPTGNNFIELLQDRININAKVTFAAGSPAYDQIDTSLQPKFNTANNAANNAQSTANAAQSQAAAALANLNNMAADNILTKQEKVAVKREWDEIVTEYQPTIDQAERYSVGYDNYYDGFANLRDYLFPTNGMLNRMDIDSAIDSTVFNQMFSDYYASRNDLLKKIALAIPSSVTVASRNLLLKSNVPLTRKGNDYYIGGYDMSVDFVVGKTYTLVVKGSHVGTNSSLGAWVASGYQGIKEDLIKGQSNVVKVMTFVRNSQGTDSNISFYHYPSGSAGSSSVEWACLYEGNISNPPMDWTPAPEDVQQQIENNAAAVAGLDYLQNFIQPTIDPQLNAIMAGRMAVGNPADGLTAILSGLNDKGGNSLRFGAGIFNAALGLFNTEILDNGTLISRHEQGTWTLYRGVQTWRDNNGNIRKIYGWVDGAPIDRRFSADGTLLYEDTVFGPRIYAIGESWSTNEWFNPNNSNILLDDNALANLMEGFVVKERGKRNSPPVGPVEGDGEGGGLITPPPSYQYWWARLSLTSNFTAYEYNPGNVDPANNQYAGFKTSAGQKSNNYNIPDGWYSRTVGQGDENQDSSPAVVAYLWLQMVFIQSGKILKTKNIVVTK